MMHKIFFHTLISFCLLFGLVGSSTANAQTSPKKKWRKTDTYIFFMNGGVRKGYIYGLLDDAIVFMPADQLKKSRGNQLGLPKNTPDTIGIEKIDKIRIKPPIVNIGFLTGSLVGAGLMGAFISSSSEHMDTEGNLATMPFLMVGTGFLGSTVHRNNKKEDFELAGSLANYEKNRASLAPHIMVPKQKSRP